MAGASKQVEIDARWVYWRIFLLCFLAEQLWAWHRVARWRVRRPGGRLLVFLLAPWATPRSFLVAFVVAGFFTLAVVLIVRLIVRPLLSFWLNPPVDASCGQFHLSASEQIVSSMPARRRAGWVWRPGALALTNRCLWFFPSNWDEEPWFLGLGEGGRIERERSRVAELTPIRNWPAALRLSGRSGGSAVFAVADPNAVMAWFGERVGQGETGLVGAGINQHAGNADV
jgi:hypothetical protein